MTAVRRQPPGPAAWSLAGEGTALREAAESVPSPFVRGPYLVAAVLYEEDAPANGGVPGIRVVDQLVRFVAGPVPSSARSPSTRTLAIFVSFRRGEATGCRCVEIVGASPSGLRTACFATELDFSGDDPAASRDVWALISFTLEGPGVYWFEVRLDGVLVTRTPLRVVHRTAERSGSNGTAAVLD